MEKLKLFYDKTFLKFIIVGVINTIVGTSIMFILYNAFGFSYWFSSSMNYIIGSIVSFFLNKYFTFKSKTFSFKEVVLFIINIAVCYLIAYGFAKWIILYIMSDYSLKIQENTAMVVGMVLFTMLNYLSQRFIVFSRGNNGK